MSSSFSTQKAIQLRDGLRTCIARFLVHICSVLHVNARLFRTLSSGRKITWLVCFLIERVKDQSLYPQSDDVPTYKHAALLVIGTHFREISLAINVSAKQISVFHNLLRTRRLLDFISLSSP
ncbi:hypothetical protein BT93_H2838 [Corymbia citriodora subsp. variegata]|nr:hypothetical protein BT93_H2838 [Corymbia citriodora subsp. variegata]